MPDSHGSEAASASEPFLGVPAPALRAIGCLTVAAARLESTVRSLAVDLLIPPKNQQAGDLLKAIRKVAAAGLPAHARLPSADVLIDWTRAAGDALYERHVPSHSAAVYRGTDWALIHLRSGNVTPMDTDMLMGAANRIAKTNREGMVLDFALRHNPRPGVYLPNAVWNGQWTPFCWVPEGGIDMARPTDAEMDEWWRIYGPIPSI